MPSRNVARKTALMNKVTATNKAHRRILKQVDAIRYGSGTTDHVSNNQNAFSNLDRSSRKKFIVANGTTKISDDTDDGSIQIKYKSDSNQNCQSTHEIPLINMKICHLLTNLMQSDLLSVSKLAKNGYEFNFKNNSCTISKDGKTLL